MESYQPSLGASSRFPEQLPVISLVTGANGFVGSHVARRLAARGEHVRALVRPSSNLRALDGLPIDRALGDLLDPPSLRAALAGVACVYHVAADYRLWCEHPEEIYRANVEGTRNLLEAARDAHIPRLVYTSTVGTIAVHRHDPLPNEATEARLDEMTGHYKRSKFMAEQEVRKAAQEGLPVVIVNPTTPVGPGDWKPTPTGRMIVDFLNGRTPAYVDTGLNIVAVEDVAEGHLLAAERGRVGERYLLGGRNMTLKEIFMVLAEVSGRPVPRWKIPHRLVLLAAYVENEIAVLFGDEPQIPLEGVRMARHKMWVNCSKATRELGFHPGPADDALRRSVEWYRENGYASRKRRTGD
ncbi:MAG: hopanoid-associated sugar epimerase [Terriglobia bacterium]